jgi:hypothetical protein
MYTFSSALKTAIDAATTQKGVSDKLNELLTNNRVLALVKDGTTIYQANMSGQITMERNAIVNYGHVTLETINIGGDLLTGNCKLRISGGGNYLECDAGLTVAAQTKAGVASPVLRDFMLSANPAPGKGIGFSRRIKTKLPAKPNGIGPLAPTTLPANAPKRWKIYSVVGGTEMLIGSATFDTPDDPLLFADSEIANLMGETVVTKCSSTIVFDKFEFGAKLYVGSATNAEDGVTPLMRVLVGCKPFNQGWDNYPAERDWPWQSVYMHPPAFRVKLEDAAGNVIYTWQGRDGTPINDPSWNQAWGNGSVPVRPLWHCAAMLPWQNVRAKISPKMNKFLPKVETRYLRPSMSRRIHTANGTEPYVDGYTNLDGYNHFYGVNRWPSAASDYQDAANNKQDQPGDPFIQYLGSNGAHSFHEFINGWDYEPGSKSLLEYQTGPGGMRFDRKSHPMIAALFATDPNWRRPKGDVPIRDMFDAQFKAYFNMPMFLFRDVQNFTGIPDNEICAPVQLWNHRNSYYGGTGGKGPDHTVDIRGNGSGSGGIWPYGTVGSADQWHDTKGQLYWNGFLPDYLHAYQQPGWASLLVNDPIYAVAAKHRYNAIMLAQLDEQTDAGNDYMSWSNRQFAWRILARVMAWKLASGKEGGHDRQVLEDAMQRGLEGIYDRLYAPAFEATPSHPTYKVIRGMGIYPFYEGSGTTAKASAGGMSLAYYLGGVMVFFKQSGMFAVMRRKNYKCQKALWFLIKCLNLGSIDLLLDTKGNGDAIYGSGNFELFFPDANGTFTMDKTPGSWAEWMTMTYQYLPKWREGIDSNDSRDSNRWDDRPQVTAVTDGWGGRAERHASIHERFQWVLNYKTFFPEPEYDHPRAAEGLALVQGFQQKVEDFVNAIPISDKNGRMNIDWVYCTPSNGKMLPPTELGDY